MDKMDKLLENREWLEKINPEDIEAFANQEALVKHYDPEYKIKTNVIEYLRHQLFMDMHNHDSPESGDDIQTYLAGKMQGLKIALWAIRTFPYPEEGSEDAI